MDSNIEQSEILTIDDAAKLLSVDEQTIRRFIKDDNLPATYLTSKTIRIFKSKLLDWMMTHNREEVNK